MGQMFLDNSFAHTESRILKSELLPYVIHQISPHLPHTYRGPPKICRSIGFADVNKRRPSLLRNLGTPDRYSRHTPVFEGVHTEGESHIVPTSAQDP